MCRRTHIYSKTTIRKQKIPLASNPIPDPEYLYLSISAFLVNLSAPNKQVYKVGTKLLTFELNSRTIYMLTIVP